MSHLFDQNIPSGRPNVTFGSGLESESGRRLPLIDNENNNRYQIIYPFTSDKIHIASNISDAAHKCYQELKDKNIITHIFIIHDIDQSNMYYFDIPKYKNSNPISSINPMNPTNSNPITSITPMNSNPVNLDVPFDPNHQKYDEITKQKYDSIISRLTNVEYGLEMVQKSLTQRYENNNDEISCTIM
jgi:hypothetical protein